MGGIRLLVGTFGMVIFQPLQGCLNCVIYFRFTIGKWMSAFIKSVRCCYASHPSDVEEWHPADSNYDDPPPRNGDDMSSTDDLAIAGDEIVVGETTKRTEEKRNSFYMLDLSEIYRE